MNNAALPGGLDYLTDYSSRDSSWEQNKSASEKVASYYKGSDYQSYSDRVEACARRLGYALKPVTDDGEYALKLRSVYLCHVRQCVVCQICRSRVWQKRFFQGLPNLIADYPSARFVFLTLTVKNCEIGKLRDNLTAMSEAFHRLLNRSPVKRVVLGYARSMEITKSAIGEAHPHFHVLIAVKAGYFTGRDYIKQDDWATMWQECLQVDYTPVTDIRVVKPGKKATKGKTDLVGAILETAKYSVKVSDLVGQGGVNDRAWLLELTKQVHAMKQINLAGIFRDYIKQGDATPEEILEGEGEKDEQEDLLFFNWFKNIGKYARRI